MERRAIGRSHTRIDAEDKVTGMAKYPGDFDLPGMLHAKVLFAGQPHARIERIKTDAAEASPGVVAVFTAQDVPHNAYGLQTEDQPVLCGPGSEQPGADVVRWEGDQIALVVAETAEAAEQGRALIDVSFDPLPVVDDPFAALQPDAPQLHAERRPNPVHPELSREGNLISHHQIRKGDVEAAWAQADVIVEGEYRTPAQEHAFLQPEAGLAYIDEDGRVAVVVAGQWTWEDQQQIAKALDLDPDQVRVIYPAIGGAFGGREDISVQIVLALAAYRLRRPVKLVWTREESIRGHCKRHAMWLRCRWGATRDGKLLAAQVRIVADGGAYCYTTNKVMGNASVTCTGPYEIPNVWVDADGVYTNNPPGGAFRGFGAPQGLFAAELQMAKLAEALCVDPVDLRLRNILDEGSETAMGTPLPGGVSLREVTEACARSVGWERAGGRWRRGRQQAPSAGQPREAEDRVWVRRGVGVAVGFKNAGFSFGYQENCWAKVELVGGETIEAARIYVGSADVGQGSDTALAQITAEALGIGVDRVDVVASDTATSPGSSGSASASRTTFMAGNAIRGAARAALDRWGAGERPAVAEYVYLAPQTTSYDPQAGRGVPNFAYGYVAQAVEVEVDTETGELHLVRVVCADDVGRAINPQMVEGQIEGGIAQAVGWATCERLVVENGCVQTPHLSTYLIPTVNDVPDHVDSIIIETGDPRGPWGVRGVGEMPFLPLAPALVAAVHDATGVWIDDLPLTPERVFRALQGDLKAEHA